VDGCRDGVLRSELVRNDHDVKHTFVPRDRKADRSTDLLAYEYALQLRHGLDRLARDRDDQVTGSHCDVPGTIASSAFGSASYISTACVSVIRSSSENITSVRCATLARSEALQVRLDGGRPRCGRHTTSSPHRAERTPQSVSVGMRLEHRLRA
jgi:hypothetical protein